MNAEVKTYPTREARLPFPIDHPPLLLRLGLLQFRAIVHLRNLSALPALRGLNQCRSTPVAATYFLVTFLTDVPDRRVRRPIAGEFGRARCALHAAHSSLTSTRITTAALIARDLDGVHHFRQRCNRRVAVDALDAAGFEGGRIESSRASRRFFVWRDRRRADRAYSARVDLAIPFLLCAIGWECRRGVGFHPDDGPVRSAKHFSCAPHSPKWPAMSRAPGLVYQLAQYSCGHSRR